MYKSRQEIERGIALAIIDTDAFADVNMYLTAKNFKDKRFAQIFTAAQNLYPTKPIDLITLKGEVELLFKNDCDQTLDFFFQNNQSIYTKANIKYWCLVILQIDIKEAFKSQLVTWKEARDSEGSIVESAVLQEIFLNSTDEVDVFWLIENALVYFENHKMAREVTLCESFNENIVKRVTQIKKNLSLDIALSHVFKLADTNPEVKYYCQKFAEAIAQMTISNKVNNNYIVAANLL